MPHELQELLEARLPALRACGAVPPRRRAESRAQVQRDSVAYRGLTLRVDAVQRELCLALAERFDLDEVEALASLHTFLASEHPALDALERSPRAQERFSEFLDAFTVFYFEEQLAVVHCVAALLRIAEDVHNELYAVATALLDRFADAAFAERCLDAFEEAVQAPLPVHMVADERYSPLWARQALWKQLALLEVVFLLYYGRLPARAALSARLLALAQRTHFGQRQAAAHFLTSEAAELVPCVQHMLVFLAVECLNLEAALDVVPAGTCAADDAALAPLAADPAALEAALAALETSADAAHAPLLLGYALLMRRLDEVGADAALARATAVLDEGPPLWRRLAQGAMDARMDLFGGLLGLATSPLLRSGAPALGASNLSALAYRAVFKGLLLTVTELVAPEYLDLDALVELWVAAFRAAPGDAPDGIAALCAQFWTHDCAHETRAAVLDAARRRFPASFVPLVRLALALSGTAPGAPAPETAAAVVDLLAHQSTLALVLPRGGLWDVAGDGEHVEYTLRAPLRVPHTSVTLPAGTRGWLVSPPDAPPVVLWQLAAPVSAWHLLRDALQQATEPARGRASAVAGDAAVWDSDAAAAPWVDEAGAADMAELLAAVLDADAGLARALLAHLGGAPPLVGAALRLLDAALRGARTHVACAAYRLLCALLPLAPHDVWQHVRATNVLIGSPGAIPLVGTDVPVSRLLAAEVAAGSFAGTLCLLDTIAAHVAQVRAAQWADAPARAAVKAGVAARAVAWVASAVWVEFDTWVYVRPAERVALARRCLDLFAAVVEDPCMVRDDAAVAPLVAAVDGVFGGGATPLTVAPLLGLLARGEALFHELYRAGHVAAAREAEALVLTALRVATTLVERGTAAARLLLGAGAGGAAPARGPLARAVLRYVAAPVPAALASAAAQLVTALSGAHDAATGPLRLAGLLGSTADVEDAARAWLGVLTNTAADRALRAAVWTMLAALVETQPALATLLLTGGHLAHDDAALADTALQVAVDALHGADALWDADPALLDALLRFLGAAWAHVLEHPRVFARVRGVAHALVRMVTRSVDAVGGASNALRVLCQARALRVLELDVRAARGAAPESVTALLALARGAEWAPTLHAAASACGADAAGAEARLAAQLPPALLTRARHAPRRDAYDRRRVFGAAYVYALDALSARCGDVPPAAAAAGHAWSAVDAHAARAQAWAECLGFAAAHMLAAAEQQGALAALRTALGRAAVAVADAVLAAPGSRERIVLLAVLATAACGGAADAPDATAALAQRTAALLDHPAYALDAFAAHALRAPVLQLMLAVVSAARRQHVPLAPLAAHAMRALQQLATLAPLVGAPQSDAARAAEADLDVLVAVVHAVAQPDAGVPPLTWLAPLRDAPVVPAALALLSHAPPLETRGMGGAPPVRFLAPLLRLVDTLAAHPLACELVVAAGGATALSTSALSALADRGAIPALLPSGDANPMHALWLLQLRVAVHLAMHAPGEVDALVHVCATQIRAALALPRDAPLAAGQLLETRAVLHLFYALWHARAARGAPVPLAHALQTHAPQLLQQLAWLYSHPRETRALLGVAEGAPDGPAAHALRDALGTLLALLWDTTHAGAMLLREPGDWPTLPALVAPTLHVAPDAPASLGTLLELAAALAEAVRAGDATLGAALEQCVGLCATQAAAWARGPLPPARDDLRARALQAQEEIDAGLGRDIEGALQTGADACASDLWPVLGRFTERYLQAHRV